MRMVPVLSVVTSLFIAGLATTAQGATDMTGAWEGEFNGVALGVTTRFGSQAPAGGRTAQAPGTGDRMETRIAPTRVATRVTANVIGQEGDQFYGRWTDGQSTYSFVCTFSDGEQVLCSDDQGMAAGTATAQSMNVCYLQSGTLNQSAGCARLSRP